MALEHYVGDAVAVYWGDDTDISAHARAVDIAETAPAPGSADTSHKGDSVLSDIQLLPGAPETDITMTVIDIYDSLTVYGTLALNTKSTLTIYPKGVTDTYPKLTCNNAVFNDRSQTIPFQGAVEVTLAFNAKNTLTRGTYSSG